METAKEDRGVRATIIGAAARFKRARRAAAGRRRVPRRAGIILLAAVTAAALLAFAPAPADAQLSAQRVLGVSITSNPGSDGFYTDGETITVQVRFSGPGRPNLFSGQSASIRIDIGGVSRSATVSGEAQLSNWNLTYAVQQGDRDLDGISIPANSLSGQFSCGTRCTPNMAHPAVDASTTQRVLAKPSAPGSFSARGGAGSATLTWTRDTDPHSSRNYQYRYHAAGESYGGWTSAGGSGASSRTVTLAAGTYDFELRARNRSGDGAAATARGVTVTAATGGGPTGPTGPTTPDPIVRAEVDPTRLTVIEGRSRTYQVRLSAAPSANVTVTIASSSAGVVTVAPKELTFTASDWSAQRVTVTAVEDDDSDDGAATLSHTLSGTGVTPTGPTLRVTVTDDDRDVKVPDPLTFGDEEVSDQRYTVGAAVKLTLPEATGGTPPLRYGLTPDLPEGLSFDADTRVLSGTPATTAAQKEYTLTVTDSAGNQEDTLSFSITVVTEAAGGAGAGEDGEATPAQASGTALTNVLAAFGSAFAADAVDVIGERFTAVGPLLQLAAPPPGASEAGALLAGSAFAAQAPGGLAFWGRGGLSGFSTATEEGSVVSGYLGVDWRLRPKLLLGGAVTYGGAGDVSYDNAGAKGKATVNLGAALPYAHWTPIPGLGVWGLAGLGGGVAAVTPAGSSAATETGVFLALGAVGARYDVLGWPGGSAAVKADGLLASLSAAEQPGLAAANATPGRVRLLIEGRTRWEFMEQSWLAPVLEVGGRYDGALGAEFGGGVSYRHTGLGLGADLRGRYLLAERQEWGASAEMSYTLGESGWSFALVPEWGLPQTGAADLWAASHDPGAAPATRLRLQAGYRPDDTFTLNVAATREEHPGPPAHALLIQGSLHL